MGITKHGDIEGGKRFRLVGYSCIYALFVGILYGTSRYYFVESQELGFGLFMAWDWVFISFGLAGFTIIYAFIYRNGKKSKK